MADRKSEVELRDRGDTVHSMFEVAVCHSLPPDEWWLVSPAFEFPAVTLPGHDPAMEPSSLHRIYYRGVFIPPEGRVPPGTHAMRDRQWERERDPKTRTLDRRRWVARANARGRRAGVELRERRKAGLRLVA